jgi:hypothetical protein
MNIVTPHQVEIRRLHSYDLEKSDEVVWSMKASKPNHSIINCDRLQGVQYLEYRLPGKNSTAFVFFVAGTDNWSENKSSVHDASISKQYRFIFSYCNPTYTRDCAARSITRAVSSLNLQILKKNLNNHIRRVLEVLINAALKYLLWRRNAGV